MKKVLLLVSALLIVFSGVAAVSAYEGHLVNVKAHVENAIGVTADHFDFGIVFPEQELTTDIYVGLSESFLAQDRYTAVEYGVFWERKPVAENVTVCNPESINGTDYYQMIREYVEVMVDNLTLSEWTDRGNGLWEADFTGILQLDDICNTITLTIDPPVFDKWYNALTDPREPSDILEEGEYCVEIEEICGVDVEVPHADLGDDLKIQVTNIIIDPGYE